MSSEITRTAEVAAAMYGVEVSQPGADGQARAASDATMRLALRELGAPVTEESDLEEAIRFRRAEMWRRTCPPVRVVREGAHMVLPLRLTSRAASGRISWLLLLEDGPATSGEARLDTLPLAGGRLVDGEQFDIRRLAVPVAIPAGYHHLIVRFGVSEVRVHVIGAPTTAHRGERLEGGWGLFHPLYGLRDGEGDRVGTFRTLASALRWTGRRGGAVFGTTPLLAAFDDPPIDPSPYAPISRLFWNDLYVGLDEEATPSSADAFVQYEDLFRVRGAVLSERANRFFSRGGSARFDFKQFMHRTPEVSSYARFRAAERLYCRDWRSWPEPARSGRIPEDGLDPGVVRRHVYAQWLADRQLSSLATEADAGLFLDMPLGTHADGYDVWSRPELFVGGASAGAPPDDYHRGGQNWGLPPLHPRRIRDEGYAYFAAALRHSMRYAALVRIDHVMQLRRLYWVFAGYPPTEGVYVRYPAKELAAVVALESRRANCEVVGEDLGTVPAAVRELMDRRQVRRTWVLGFSLPTDQRHALEEVPPGAVAAIGTHDTAPLCGLRAAVDIDDREDRGLLLAEEARELRVERSRRFRALSDVAGAAEPVEASGRDQAAAPDPTLPGVIRILRQSRAGLILLPLDDLAGETHPQNVPGTTTERPNWRRRLPVGLEDLGASPAAAAVLAAIQGDVQ